MRLGGGAQAHVIGPACGSSGQRADERAHMRRMRSQKQKMDLTARRCPDALYTPRETTGAVTAPSVLKSHPTNNT